MKRLLRTFLYAVLILAGTLALSELALRMVGPKEPLRKAQQRIIPRMWAVWSRPAAADHFSPPYRYAFNNARSGDEGRLKMIVQKMKLPRGHWRIPDFLRDPAQGDAVISLVSLDLLGFRGAAAGRTVVKKPGTARIIVLGTYQAFGHGVNDWETYSFYLEKMLNASKPGGKEYEVWNMGRPGATVIMGWAQLSLELLKYQPDLIIWDFGFNDMALKNRGSVGDFLVKNVPGFKNVLRFIATQPALAGLRICQRSFFLLFVSDRKKNLGDWNEVHGRLMKLVREKDLPIILLRHGASAVPAEGYKSVMEPDAPAHFLDTTIAVQRAKARPEEIEEFWSKPNYLAEVGGKRSQVGDDSNTIYRTDALHYNRFGHRVIARALYTKVVQILAPSEAAA